MVSDISNAFQVSLPYYPRLDSTLSFAEYAAACQSMIIERREDFDRYATLKDVITKANSPFEYQPDNQAKIGVLLVHGLLDCPFTYRELGQHLQTDGMLVRSILLPGHGTKPDDLLSVTYQDWQSSVRYGLETLHKKVDKIFVVGYSTGAALAMAAALEDSAINGLVLLSPAVKLRMPVDIAVNLVEFTNFLGKDQLWVARTEENDYVKYRSITLNSAKQVMTLAETVREKVRAQPITLPVCMVMSKEDETVSSQDAIELFTCLPNPQNKFLLYSAANLNFSDKRIEVRLSLDKSRNITHLSHASLLFSAQNFHYGENGDFAEATSHEEKTHVHGAYNRIEINAYEMMAKYNLVKHPRRTLTYNPDFQQLAECISRFIQQNA